MENATERPANKPNDKAHLTNLRDDLRQRLQRGCALSSAERFQIRAQLEGVESQILRLESQDSV